MREWPDIAFLWIIYGLLFHGVDIDPEAVAWCKERIEFARFSHISQKSVLPYEEATFDAIYAYSIFSYLSEAKQRAWLEEVHRVARADGISVVTVHGKHVVKVVMNGT